MQENPLPPWHERLPLAFWRGSTTGSKDIDLNSIESNRRYQLARLSQSWPDRLDARINRAVQCRDALAREQVEHRLQRGGTAEHHGEPMACRPSCVADRHRRQRELLGTAMEASFRELHPASGKPKTAVVSPTASALGASGACERGSERSGRATGVVQHPPPRNVPTSPQRAARWQNKWLTRSTMIS